MTAPEDPDQVDCTRCGATVERTETCRQGTCRGCHVSLTLEDCLAEDDERDAQRAKQEALIAETIRRDGFAAAARALGIMP